MKEYEKKNSGQAKTAYLNGIIFNGLGQYNDALSKFNDCLNLDPDFYDCLVERAKLNFKLGHHNDGCIDLEKCQKLLKTQCKCSDIKLDELFLKSHCK